jgi:uncharacterized phage-associated protein
LALDDDLTRPTLSGMPVSAHDVAAALRARQPGLPVKKLHKLLYYCQGHHLAAFGEPLFSESVMAWDMGPVVGSLWFSERNGEAPPVPAEALTEAQLNTIGYVVSRYGALTGKDLENLTHSEPPWRTADSLRPAGQSVRIEQDWMRAYFATDGSAAADQEIPLDAAVVAEWLRDAEARRQGPARPDTREEILRRLSRDA